MMWFYIALAVGYLPLGMALHALFKATEKSSDAFLRFAFGDVSSSPSKPWTRDEEWWFSWFCFWLWPFPTAIVLIILLVAVLATIVFRLPVLYIEWVAEKPWEGWSKRWSEWYRSERIVEKKPPPWGGF